MRNYLAIMLLARLALRRNHHSVQPAMAGGGNARRIGLVGDDDSDPRIGNAPAINAVSDGNEIRSAAGEKNPQGMHC